MKECFKCGELKPISEFYRHLRMRDGHLGKCKKCTKGDVRNHRLVNRIRVMAYDRWRYRGKTGRKTSTKNKAEYLRRYREKYPEKSRVHDLVTRAIRDGHLVRPNKCEECSSAVRPEAHHEDYSKPFEIIWLCTSCHGKTRWKHDDITP